MPQLGESIAEATIVNLLVQPGDQVNSDQDIIEVETNKATMNVTSPASGELVEFTIKVNESYTVGAVLGYLEVSVEETEKRGLNSSPAKAVDPLQVSEPTTRRSTEQTPPAQVQPTIRGLPVPAAAA